MPALPPYIIEPIWQQFLALLPSREVNHPLGCHRHRIPNRVVFEADSSGVGVRLRLLADRRRVVLGHHATPPARGVDRGGIEAGARRERWRPSRSWRSNPTTELSASS